MIRVIDNFENTWMSTSRMKINVNSISQNNSLKYCQANNIWNRNNDHQVGPTPIGCKLQPATRC